MKRILYVLGLAAVFAAGLAVAALANNPPGQDPCSHGATGNECRPDPSTNGQDCEHHGNHGGVNEDHCLPPPTETTPTETTPTTPTETTPTTPTTTTPPPFSCPDGRPPEQNPVDPHDNCKRPTPPSVVTVPVTPNASPPETAPPPPPAPPTATATTGTTVTAPPAKPKPPKTKPPVVVHKPAAKKPPHLTGNPKQDKCKKMAGNVLNCKGIVVVPGQG